MLIDPCIAKTFSFPRDLHELNQQLSHNYVTYYDNISEMKDWISDELCERYLEVVRQGVGYTRMKTILFVALCDVSVLTALTWLQQKPTY